MDIAINSEAKVSDSITIIKQRDLDNRRNVLPNHNIEKVSSIPIPITEMDDKLIQKYTTHGEFSIKIVT